MISAFHTYLIDSEIQRLEAQAERHRHNANMAALSAIFGLAGSVDSDAHRHGTGILLTIVAGSLALSETLAAGRMLDDLDDWNERRSPVLEQDWLAPTFWN